MSELIKRELLDCIDQRAEDLNFPDSFLVDDSLEPVNKRVFLAAFSLNESSGGWNITPRYEKVYGPGGRYYNDLQRKLYLRYGDDACKSYGPFQIMFPIYFELGFMYTVPEIAGKFDYQMPVVIKYFNKRIFNHADRGEPNFLGMAGDAYNSGNYRDNIVPREYISRLIRHYHLARQYMGIEIPHYDKPWPGNI
jgi:hypothetical protein